MHGIGVQRKVIFLREMEDADQVYGIVLKHILVDDVDAVIVDDEIVAFAQRGTGAWTKPRHHAAQHRHRLGLAVLELAAEYGGENARVLCGHGKKVFETAAPPPTGVGGGARPAPRVSPGGKKKPPPPPARGGK